MHDPASSSQPPATPNAPAQSSSPLNPASIVAIVGGLLAIISFFALSYYSFGYGPVVGSITGRDFATVSATGISQGYAVLWLVPIAGAVALVVGLLPLGLRTLSPRTSGIIFAVAGAVGVLTLIVTYVRINNEVNASGTPIPSGVSYGFGIGYWLSAIGMIAVIVAGVLASRSNQS